MTTTFTRRVVTRAVVIAAVIVITAAYVLTQVYRAEEYTNATKAAATATAQNLKPIVDGMPRSWTEMPMNEGYAHFRAAYRQQVAKPDAPQVAAYVDVGLIAVDNDYYGCAQSTRRAHLPGRDSSNMWCVKLDDPGAKPSRGRPTGGMFFILNR